MGRRLIRLVENCPHSSDASIENPTTESFLSIPHYAQSDRPPPTLGGTGGVGARSRTLLSSLHRSIGTKGAVDGSRGGRSDSSSSSSSSSNGNSSVAGSLLEEGSLIRRPFGTPSGLHPQHRPAQALLSPPADGGPIDDLAAAKGMLPPPIITTLPFASGAGRVGDGPASPVHDGEAMAAASASGRHWWPSWLQLRRTKEEEKKKEGEGSGAGADLEGSLHRHQQHDEHEVLADEVSPQTRTCT
jgi:hypothetical protein